MRVGVPSEVKNHEYRVAITPAGVHELVRNGHQVSVQAGAGLGSSIADAEFAAAGATIAAGTGCSPVRCCSPTCTSPRVGTAPARCWMPG